MPKQSLEEQFLTMYDSHADAIFRHCYFRVYDRERAKELTQEAFTRTWEYLSEGHTVDNIRAFVYKTLQHLIIDASRKKKEQSLDAMMDKGHDPHHTPDLGTVVDAALVTTQLAQIEEPYRSALYMRYIDDLNPREIAEVTGEDVNVISVRIHRATKKLKTLATT
jgi:RNA polymerase sigma-70 factor (ECF subfamily)